MRRFLPALLFVAWLSALSASARAQDEFKVESAQSPLACLKHEDASAVVDYPEDAVDRRSGGLLKVRLTFTSADSAPRAEIVGNSGDPRFEKSVRRYVRGYRLPCMASGAAPVDAFQEFLFDPHGERPVVSGEPQGDTARERNCTMLDGTAFPWRSKPHYPRGLLSRGTGGAVLADITFTSPTEAPTVKILFDGGEPQFAKSVTDFIERARMGCLQAGEQVTVRMPFHFSVQGERALVLKDLDLRQLVGAADAQALKQPAHQVKFDLSAMGCPFQVRMSFWQPYASNSVAQVGSSDPRRAPLLKWLSTIPLKLTPRQQAAVLGQPMTLSIPCGTIDLT